MMTLSLRIMMITMMTMVRTWRRKTNNDRGDGDGCEKIDLEWCETFGKFHALRMTNNNDGVDGDGRHL